MHTDYEFIITAILCGIVGWVYSVKLTEADMILNWWYLFCDQKLPKWIAKPICTCEKCVSGQMGLWVFLFTDNSWQLTFSNIFNGICAVCISILTAVIINKHYGE